MRRRPLRFWNRKKKSRESFSPHAPLAFAVPVLRYLLIPLALGYILLRVVWFVPIMMVRQWQADGRASRNPYTPAATPASVPCARSLHLVRAPGEPPQAHARLAHPSPSACL